MNNIKPLIPAVIVSIVLLLMSQAIPTKSFADGTALNLIAGLSTEEALRVGERMYREGVLSSGEAMQAIVQGDIPVDSRMFSCMSCHLRSGLGSLEGQVVTYPIDGITLFKPITNAWNMRWVSGSRYSKAATGILRSAYNDETLAAAIRGGVNPDGKTLNYTMPRYPLNDRDMEIMVFYLRNLSARPSPGVVDGDMRFATIVTEGVSREDIDAMLTPLKTMAGVSKSGNLSKMARLAQASDPDDLMNKGYVKASLDVWELQGSEDSWRSQLESYYKKGPVFALIGGITKGSWSQIHKFCEERKLPCILPITDLPEISDSDWYTVYFSKGIYQETGAAARYLLGSGGIAEGVQIIEIYRDNEMGRAAAKSFDEAWEGASDQKIQKVVLSQDEPVTDNLWKKLLVSNKDTVIVAWLGEKDAASIKSLPASDSKLKMIFMSSTLLGREMYALPDKIRKLAYITYPYRLPEDIVRYQPLPAGSAGRNMTLADYKVIRNKANFNLMLLTKSIFMLKGYYLRDRFLEVTDMMKDELMVPLYPRLSFGPGQRYLSKGCYIVQLGEGPQPKVISKSDWVIP